MSLSSTVEGDLLSLLEGDVSDPIRMGKREGEVNLPPRLLGFNGEGEFDLAFLWEMMS